MGLNKTDLFYNINKDDQGTMITCFNTTVKKYKTGEIICYFDDMDKGLGIIEEGNALVIRSFSNGNQAVLEYLTQGDIFGQLFYFYANNENISVECSTDCSIRFIDYFHLVKRCEKACKHHSQLVNNILSMISEKTQDISEHLEVLSQRSIRDKLISYFDILSNQNNSNTFQIPFTISVLADYLSVDRSAMSRELGKMRDDGLIKMNKRKVTLLY